MKRKFILNLATRLLIICFFGWLTGYLIFNSPYWLSGLWTGLIAVAIFYLTLKYVVQSEHKLATFLQALGQNDFSITFSENKASRDYDLNYAFNTLNQVFLKLRSEKEVQHQLLQIVVEHAAVPLICFDDVSHEVFLVNEAAKNLFQSPYLKKINSLRKLDPILPDELISLEAGEKISRKLNLNSRTIYLSISAQYIFFNNKMIKLIAFVDVSSELAAKEAETWRKLLRVLTHEISNSAIPLSTLSAHIHGMVSEAQSSNRDLSLEERQDIIESLHTIDERSRSLNEFVQNFRNVNRIPEPQPEKLNLKNIVHDALQLYSYEFEKRNIALEVDLSTTVFIYADKSLTLQVLINLIKNAIEAMDDNLKDNKRLKFTFANNGHRYVNLNIHDSGVGISPDEIDQIFIPFFSTKKGGSGIGLSVSQQIMQLQKGDISVQSQPGKGTVFTLSFCCF